MKESISSAVYCNALGMRGISNQRVTFFTATDVNNHTHIISFFQHARVEEINRTNPRVGGHLTAEDDPI